MNLEKYDFKGKFEDKGDKKVSYIFVSIGIKGNILKGVYFQPKNDFEYNYGVGGY